MNSICSRWWEENLESTPTPSSLLSGSRLRSVTEAWPDTRDKYYLLQSVRHFLPCKMYSHPLHQNLRTNKAFTHIFKSDFAISLFVGNNPCHFIFGFRQSLDDDSSVEYFHSLPRRKQGIRYYSFQEICWTKRQINNKSMVGTTALSNFPHAVDDGTSCILSCVLYSYSSSASVVCGCDL